MRRRARAFEALESRVLLTTTDYILDGNTLTTITNGVSSSVTVANVNNVQIVGDATLNHITLQNFSGHATVSGGGGGDQITVYGGSGGTVTVQGTTASDQLVVRAPLAVVANVTVGASSISVGSDTVNYGASVASISVVGQLFASGDTLTINGGTSAETVNVTPASVKVGSRPTVYYSTFTSLNVNGGGGNDTFNVDGDTIPTYLTAGAGDATFNVNTNSVALSITGGGSGSDTYNINSNAGPLTVTGQGAANTFVVNSSAASLTLNGGSAANTYAINSNSASLTINGGTTANDVTIGANSGAVVVNGGTGTDHFTVNTTTGIVTLRGGAGATTSYNITSPTIGPVNVVGNSSGSGVLTFHGTVLHDVFAVTASALSAGTGSTVNYSNLTQVIVDGVGGDDTFLVTSAGTPTTLLGQDGDNTFNVRADTAQVTIDSGTGTNTINVGSNAPGQTGNVLAGVLGGVKVIGSGHDLLNIDDAGNTAATTAQLSTTGFTGIGGGVTYSGLATLNVKMGSGGNRLNVTGSPAATATNVNLGSGINAVTVGSLAPALGGMTDDVLGAVTLTGSGADDLVVDDSGNASPKTATLDPAVISGMSPAAIHYVGFDALTINLGTGGNDFSILNTNAATATTVNGGAGDDVIRILADASATSVTTGGGADVVAVRTISAATNVTSAGGATIVVGTLAPSAGGLLAGIQAPLTVIGGGGDTLTLDNTGATAAASGVVSAVDVTGFGMAAAGVAYANIGTLNLNLGAGNNAVTVADTAAVTTTNINGGAGADVITVQLDSGATNISAGGGDDVVNIQANNGVTTIDTGTGADVVNVGSSSNVVDGVTAALSIHGNTTAVLNIDDSGDVVGKTGTLTSTTLTGISGGTITYDGIAALNLTLGSGADTLAIRSTSTQTHVKTGLGDNLVTAGDGGSLGGIAGTLDVDGGGSSTFSLDDSANTADTTATLTGSSLVGLSPADITFSNLSALSLTLGTGADTFNIDHTIAGSILIQSAGGDDTINIHATDGDTTIDTGAGSNGVNIGDGQMDDILGAVHIQGSGSDTLNLLDGGSAADKTATLAVTSATGLSPADIDFTGLSALNLLLGSGDNTVTIASTAAGAETTLTAGSGANTINVRSIDSLTTLNLGPAANTVNVGSLVPAGFSLLDQINSSLVIHGGGADQVNLDDSGDSLAKNVVVSATDVTGASPVPITFDNLGVLRLRMGAGNDTLTVADSSAFLTLNTGRGSDQVNVLKTTRDITVQTGGGGDVVTVGSLAPATGGTIDQINGLVVVSGDGTDTLIVDDSGNTIPKVGGLTASSLTGLSPAAIPYSGLAYLNILLGSGNDTMSIVSTAAGAATTVNTGSGANQVNVGAAAGAGNGMAGLLGTVAINGSGSDTLRLSDAGATGARSGSMSASQVLVSGASVSYAGLSTLDVTLAGSTTFAARATAAVTDTTIHSAGGTITVGGTLTAGIAGPLSIRDSGQTDLVVDDSGDASGRSVTITASTVAGLSPVAIQYDNVKSLTVLAGGGDDHLAIVSTSSSPVTVNTGAGNNTILVGSPAPAVTSAIGGHLTVNGGGSAVLTLDDSGETADQTVAINGTTVGGLNPGGIDYSGLSSLVVNLGSGSDQVGVTGTSVATLINAGDGDDSITVTNPALLSRLTVTGADGFDTLSVDDSGDLSSGTVTLAPSSINGIGAGIDYSDFAKLSLKLGANQVLAINEINPQTATSVSVPSGTGTVIFAGDFDGQLTLDNFSTGTITVGGDFNGTLLVTGGLKSLTIGGRDAGEISVGSVGLIGVANASPANGSGILFSVTQGGVFRDIRAIVSDGVAASGVRAIVAYDGVTGPNPQAVVELSNANPKNRFDLLLEAPADSSGFDLTRLSGIASKGPVGVRNIAVVGDILNKGPTALQDAYLGETGNNSGGIVLPFDRLGVVSVTGDLALWSIKALSVQGIAFGTVTMKNGDVWTASRVTASKKWHYEVLMGTLAVNPKNNKPVVKIAKPAETIRFFTGSSRPVGLFIGKTAKAFAAHAAYFSDQQVDGAPPVLAEASYATKWPAGRPVMASLTFYGDGGSVNTDQIVQNLASTGAIGDLLLKAGKPETLQSFEAPSLFGQLKLFGGKLAKSAAKAIALVTGQ